MPEDEILQPAAQEAVDSLSESAGSGYRALVVCGNCGAEGSVRFPRGTAIADSPCSHCGLRRLTRVG